MSISTDRTIDEIESSRKEAIVKLKAMLQASILRLHSYVQTAAKLKTSLRTNEKFAHLNDKDKNDYLQNELLKWPETKNLNEKTKGAIIELTMLLPDNINPTHLLSAEELQKFLDATSYQKLIALHNKIISLEDSQDVALFWGDLASQFNMLNNLAQATLTPLANYPFVTLLSTPILNGINALSYGCDEMAARSDPGLGTKALKHKKRANTVTNVFGVLSCMTTVIALFFPPFLMVAAMSLMLSNIISSGNSLYEFAQAMMKNKKSKAYPWQIVSQASNIIYSVGALVVAAMVMVALFTPVGWAAGSGLITFTAISTISSLCALMLSKYAAKKASAIESTEHAKPIVKDKTTVSQKNQKPKPSQKVQKRLSELQNKTNTEQYEKNSKEQYDSTATSTATNKMPVKKLNESKKKLYQHKQSPAVSSQTPISDQTAIKEVLDKTKELPRNFDTISKNKMDNQFSKIALDKDNKEDISAKQHPIQILRHEPYKKVEREDTKDRALEREASQKTQFSTKHIKEASPMPSKSFKASTAKSDKKLSRQKLKKSDPMYHLKSLRQRLERLESMSKNQINKQSKESPFNKENTKDSSDKKFDA